MSESYLVTGCELPPGSSINDVVKTICVSAGIKHRQLDEIHLYTDAASALFQRKHDSEAGPIFTWPLLPLLSASGLQALCRALETGELSLCLLAEISPAGSNAVLLANPNAVGRFNLSPLVHLAKHLSHVDGLENLPTTALKTLASAPAEIEPDEQAIDLRIPKAPPPRPWLMLHTSQKIDLSEWPDDRLIQNPGLCGSLLSLASAMKKTRTDRGIWMSLSMDGPVLSTLVLPL